LRRNIGLSAGYFRTSWGAIQQDDEHGRWRRRFHSFCVTAPVNPSLPSGGSYPICGLYDSTGHVRLSSTVVREATS